MSGTTRMFLKILTGIVYLPLAILLNYIWGKWEESSLAVRVLVAPLIVLIYIVVAPLTDWWGNL